MTSISFFFREVELMMVMSSGQNEDLIKGFVRAGLEAEVINQLVYPLSRDRWVLDQEKFFKKFVSEAAGDWVPFDPQGELLLGAGLEKDQEKGSEVEIVKFDFTGVASPSSMGENIKAISIYLAEIEAEVRARSIGSHTGSYIVNMQGYIMDFSVGLSAWQADLTSHMNELGILNDDGHFQSTDIVAKKRSLGYLSKSLALMSEMINQMRDISLRYYQVVEKMIELKENGLVESLSLPQGPSAFETEGSLTPYLSETYDSLNRDAERDANFILSHLLEHRSLVGENLQRSATAVSVLDGLVNANIVNLERQIAEKHESNAIALETLVCNPIIK